MSQPSPHPESLPHKEGGPVGSRIFAVLAYVLPVVGGAVGLAIDGSNPLTRHHARQSMAAVLTLVLGFVVWAVGGFIIGMIPIVGPIVALALFALVIALAIFLALNWVYSLVMAARGLEREIPFANRLASRVFGKGDKAKAVKTSA